MLIMLFIEFVIPQLIDSTIGLVNDIPTYINDTSDFFSDFFDKLNLNAEYREKINDHINQVIEYGVQLITNFIPFLGGLVKDILSSIWNIVIGIIISIYLLKDKEKFLGLSKKMAFAIFPKNAANKIIEIGSESNNIFGKFLSGKILDSFIIGVLTFIILSIFGIPYTILVAVIIGVTNIVPFFGDRKSTRLNSSH